MSMEYEGVFFWHHTGPYGFLSNDKRTIKQ